MDTVLSQLEPHFSRAEELVSFARLLFSDSDADAIAEMPAAGLAGVIEQVDKAHTVKQGGVHKINVWSAPDLGGDGEERTVVLIINDDMPFLVDSVLGELQHRGINAHLVLHPILKVERSRDGKRARVIGRGDGSWGDGLQESIFIAIVDPLFDTERSALTAALDHVLADVRIAVADWQPMLRRLEVVLQGYEAHSPKVAPGVLSETLAFCRWLIGGQFTFLGLREYECESDKETGALLPISGHGLGVLRDPGVLELSKGGKPLSLTPESYPDMFGAHPLILTKSDILSRIHRRTAMDFISLKTYGENGLQTGAVHVVGLYTSQAYTERPRAIPLLRQKVETVLGRTGFAPSSHDGKAVISVIENFPRDELFRIGDNLLTEWVCAMLDLDLRPRVRLLARRDRFDRFVSALVYVPRERFSTQIRARIGSALEEAYKGTVSTYTPFFPEAPVIRVHYMIDRLPDTPREDVDVAALEKKIDDIAQMWRDRLTRVMDKAGPDVRVLWPKYKDAFSSGYAETFPASRALEDIGHIERLSPDRPMTIDFHAPASDRAGQLQATIYQLDEPIPLSERVPVLENFGFRSIDERSYRVTPTFEAGERQVALHAMVLAPSDGEQLDIDKYDERLEQAFIAVRRGEADSDPFNRLVVAADAGWRMVAMLRAYAAYMRQIGMPYGMRYVSDTLVCYPDFTRKLIDLFNIRFDPDLDVDMPGRAQRQQDLRAVLREALNDVPSLDEDRILSAYIDLIAATKRTNFFQTKPDGSLPENILFKMAPQEMDRIPEPRPFREIWCYSPRVEGVHLRFGPIARGGIRWSDRAQDFRTEVLGLCKAQQVKNAVIVPQGAKGGFFPKCLPRGGDRQTIGAEALASYCLFVSSMLDITDNLVDGTVVPPERVVRHDGDDTYLVVAADKGTASYSDYANEISISKGYWLGDAFASGGSAGYDHKKMGITARGAWECVKRHFREIDRDIQNEPFSVVGVGDMSGDVFGNGMLLSAQTRLIAAFDHRDIFIDPDPDPGQSHNERKRLFGLERSSWQDYDRSKLSAGGGVFSRSAKSVPLSPEIREALGLVADRLTPNELIRSILTSDVDLLWFGGIGTYVRSPDESDGDVGDRANDSIRVVATDLRVKVIGEGANLGVTQAGRVAFAQSGGRINTDFIDNSAGVNSSDKEVNIKIALGRAVRESRMDTGQRNALLETMTEDVAQDCLRNNYQQSLAISLAERRGVRDGALLARLLRQLEARDLITRELEGLPTDPEIAERLSHGSSFTRPEIAVLMSWSKIALTADLMQTDVPDDETNLELLMEYFPEALVRDHRNDLLAHPLRREIIVMRIANSMINRAGPAMSVRLGDATGRGARDIAAAFMGIRTIYELPRIWSEIDVLDAQIPGRVQLDLYAQTQGLLLDQAAELLRVGGDRSVSRYVAQYDEGLRTLRSDLDAALTVSQKEGIEIAGRAFANTGVPKAVAREMAQLDALKQGLAIVRLASESQWPVIDVARVLFEAMAFLRVDELKRRADELHVTDYYDRLALTGALGALRAAGRALTRDVLRTSQPGLVDLDAWIANHGSQVEAAKRQIDDIVGAGDLTISRLTVAASQIRELTSGD